MATTKTVIERDVADLLGGAKVVGRINEPKDIQHAIRVGLPYAALEALTAALELKQRDVTAALGMAPRTLARRKHERALSAVESDRLYRVARISHLAAEVLGDLSKARAWLGRGNRSLGGNTPLSMLDTEVGARQVEEALLHINFGIYA
jgi:putative toxin-antitoxin system antitoxin component (TIGR02293 family)